MNVADFDQDEDKCMYSYYNKNDNIHKNEVQNIGFGIPIEFLSQRKKLFNSVQKQRNWTFVV